MRLITYSNNKELRPGIILDANYALDLQIAFDVLQKRGDIGEKAEAPSSIIALIQTADNSLSWCQQILDAGQAGTVDAALLNIADIRLVAPIPRPLKNVFCVGSNYRAHVSEANRAQKKEDKAPGLPVFFTKPPTAVIGPDDGLLLDPNVSENMDYEVELAVIIGSAGRNIKKDAAISHIFGFTIVNDVTFRDLQRAHGGQYLKGKGLDTTCPMGPCIVTIDELSNFENLRISLTVNGEMRQDGNTRDMIFSIPRLLESLSEGLTLEAGDILATGTPSGVGYAMEPPKYLKHGDLVVCEIEGIGSLGNVVENSELVAAQ